MAQKTNLNISPYYDDFDPNDQFYKVLFKPGFPVQARELTTLQSGLQNQLESFGNHIFKDGSMVIPGGISYNDNYYSIKIEEEHLGTPVTLYLNWLTRWRDKDDKLFHPTNLINGDVVKKYLNIKTTESRFLNII